jgi:hypothetical protein
MVGRAGVTTMETKDIVIVRGAVPLIEPEVAVITADPLDTALTRPLPEIDIRALLETLQFTELLRF